MRTILVGTLLVMFPAAVRGAPQTTSVGPTPPGLGDSLATWYAMGFNAHHLCAGLWVVGRDHRRTPETVVAQDIARFPAFRWESDFQFEVDETTRTATVIASAVGRRSARYTGDQGCSILPVGARDVFFEPVPVRPNLPDPAGQDWPNGDRNAEGRFADINQPALEAALDWAFNDAGLQRPQYTRGVVAVHRNRIVAERYAPGFGPHTPQISWSMGKSIAATLVGVLIQDGVYTLDQPAPVPE